MSRKAGIQKNPSIPVLEFVCGRKAASLIQPTSPWILPPPPSPVVQGTLRLEQILRRPSAPHTEMPHSTVDKAEASRWAHCMFLTEFDPQPRLLTPWPEPSCCSYITTLCFFSLQLNFQIGVYQVLCLHGTKGELEKQHRSLGVPIPPHPRHEPHLLLLHRATLSFFF